MTVYVYPKRDVVPSQLADEIERDLGVRVVHDRVEVTEEGWEVAGVTLGDRLYIVLERDLSPREKGRLDRIVDGHTPRPIVHRDLAKEIDDLRERVRRLEEKKS